MKIGKEQIYQQPVNEITWLGAYAQQRQAEAEARGEVLPPAIRLQIGEPSFRTPEHIRQAAIRSIECEPQTYAPAVGHLWLRELLAEKIRRINGYAVEPAHIAITMGGTGALQVALIATVGPGDEVLIPDPGWPLYAMQLAACGATGVPYPLDPQGEWLPDIAQLEKLVTPRTRVLLINTPGNPTGAVFPREIVCSLLDFARRHDLYLLSDECYDQIIFEGEHISPATMLSREEFESGRFIGVYTFSKTYAMTGWRIGYLTTGTQLMKTIVDVLNAKYTNISTLTQRAAAAALTGPQDCVSEMREAYQRRRDLAVSLLKDDGRYIYTPHGAFYALIDISSRKGEARHSRQFALDLLHERNVAVAAGSGFGSVAQANVRISLAACEEEIERGVREICSFADR
ncbi:MAG TPA: aminotransferase class I/II-fold pyridoxal phosphate-dependent enzyme [Ktedonosporobacter sp.]|jgi:aspartate aminotransferase/aminotransferase|nr:aminotransferase class I/II-fold pyridoxal phosphate-dependent enzyme [Ktedonosporobacter sp.]